MSDKPHKFFYRDLDCKLNLLSIALQKRYRKIEKVELIGISALSEDDELFLESSSVSTSKWRQYNVFQFHIPELHKLFASLRSMVIEACEYYEVDFIEQQFMVQGWFNIFQPDQGTLDWHDHSRIAAPHFHGYYSVNAEPSITQYQINGDIVDIENINNRAILSEATHPHRVIPSNIKNRITVAYDVIPLKDLINSTNKKEYEQHWLPMV